LLHWGDEFVRGGGAAPHKFIPGLSNAGLAHDEIENQVRKLLPDRLPQEVFELYQWRNGCSLLPRTTMVKVDETFYHCEEGYILRETSHRLAPFPALQHFSSL
jgi:hypothetical protein